MSGGARAGPGRGLVRYGHCGASGREGTPRLGRNPAGSPGGGPVRVGIPIHPPRPQEKLIGLGGGGGRHRTVVLVGFYRMIAGVIFAFDVPLPEGAAAPF